MYDFVESPRDKVTAKLKGLSEDNVIRKQVVKDENADKHRDKFSALDRIVCAGREACDKGESFDTVKSDMMEAMHHVMDMKEEKYEEVKPKEKSKQVPFKHKGDSIYVKSAAQPAVT